MCIHKIFNPYSIWFTNFEESVPYDLYVLHNEIGITK